jgi:Ni/Co efflux regulator RcnB
LSAPAVPSLSTVAKHSSGCERRRSSIHPDGAIAAGKSARSCRRFFLVRDYWYPDWGLIGLPPPPPDYQWVRYGSDLLMVDLTSGEVIDVVYDVFY